MSQLPISGGLLMSCVLYAGVSIGAGQMIAGRMIDRSGWEEICDDALRSDLQSRVVPEPYFADTRCDTLVGWLHPDLNQLCGQFGNPDLAGPGARVAREAERRMRDFENERLRRAAANTGSRCSCAGTVYARETLVGWGLYAGSGRLISTPRVESMQSGLREALSSPFCAGFSEVLP